MAFLYDSDSENEKGKGSCAAKKRLPSARKLLLSSSDEDSHTQVGDYTPIDYKNGTRKSQRKKKRFCMPSRDKQWEAIKSQACVKLSNLKPRKLINDFTRITHRYNCDHEEVSGEESMEEFIKNTDSSDSTTDKESFEDVQSKKAHKIKGFRSRILTADTSNEDSAQEQSLAAHLTSAITSAIGQDVTVNCNSDSAGLCPKENIEADRRKSGKETHDFDSDNSDSAVALTVTKKSRKCKAARKSVISSDSDEDSNALRRALRKRQITVQKSESPERCESDNTVEYQLSNSYLKVTDFKTSYSNECSCSTYNCTGNCIMAASSGTADVFQTPHKTVATDNNEHFDYVTEKSVQSASSDSANYDSESYNRSGSSCRDDDNDGEAGDEKADKDDNNGLQFGRIEELAARKKTKRDSMFSQFQAARAKRLKKASDLVQTENKN